MLPWLPLAIPVGAWVWHLARAARGRDYPFITLAVAIGAAVTLAVGILVCWHAFFSPAVPPRGGPSIAIDPIVVTAFASWVLALLFVPLELVILLVWAVARAVRGRASGPSERPAVAEAEQRVLRVEGDVGS